MQLRRWFISVANLDPDPRKKYAVTRKLRAFMSSLLTVLNQHLAKMDPWKGGEYPVILTKIRANDLADDKEVKALSASQVTERQKCLASKFRKRMTENDSFDYNNNYRQDFYKEVIQLAEKVNPRIFHHFFEDDRHF
jgi:hypothetical protein